MDNIEEKIVKILAEQTNRPKIDFTTDALLGENLGIDSLDKVEIVMRLEEDFSIQISDEEAEKVSTVGELFEVVKSIVRAGGLDL